MASDLPAEVVRFITEFIDSASLLDALLLLRATPDKEWTANEVARALVSNEQAAQDQLAQLARTGLASVAGEGAFTYAPGAHGPTVDALAESYARRRHTVIGVIYGKDTGPATVLADAFRIRKRRRDG